MQDTVLEREGYLKRLAVWIDKPIVKVITGQRRVGKSKFIFQIINHIRKNNPDANIIYINTEEEKYQHIRDYVALQSEVNAQLSAAARNYLFVDEIQDIAEFERALRGYLAENRCDIYCTGSNSKLMSGELASFLSGRFVEFKVHPLSFSEFCLFHNLTKTGETLLKYFRFGGMPFLRHLPLEDSTVNEYLQSIYNTILLRDIAERYKIRNLHLLKVLSRFIADSEGAAFSSLSISKYLKSAGMAVSPKSILDYADYLKNAMIINQVERYDMAGKKMLTSGGKMYFEDFGLRNAIVGGFKLTDIQKILENAVYMHLVRQNYKVSVGQLRQQEVDFIAEKDGKKCYIQVAYKLSLQETIDREFGNLLLIKDNFPKIVVSMDELAGIDYQGIKHIHVLDFLQREAVS
ncbi:MAG: ATP-binding protein [Prevotellaceae bacterium]|jgi:predicted AAA+ superfamily ATPase|nr:ATP-binding protein [Prevotellaceae bacterium]